MSIAMEPPSEARIVASWTRNVSQWTRSVRQQQIVSRTLESWVRLFTCHELRLLELREPIHPRTGRPASALFVAQSPATAAATAVAG
jgi:hypothetical protein